MWKTSFWWRYRYDVIFCVVMSVLTLHTAVQLSYVLKSSMFNGIIRGGFVPLGSTIFPIYSNPWVPRFVDVMDPTGALDQPLFTNASVAAGIILPFLLPSLMLIVEALRYRKIEAENAG